MINRLRFFTQQLQGMQARWGLTFTAIPLLVLGGSVVLMGLAGELRLDLSAIGLSHGIWLSVLLARKQYRLMVVPLLLCMPLVSHYGWQIPQAMQHLQNPGHLWLQGTLRQQDVYAAFSHPAYAEVPADSKNKMALPQPNGSERPLGWVWRLGQVAYQKGNHSGNLVELEVVALGAKKRFMPNGIKLRLGGALQRQHFVDGRLQVVLSDVVLQRANDSGARWRAKQWLVPLQDRAAFYLSASGLAVYLPVILGVKTRHTPEARRVIQSFRRVGVAHLFAISGLHVGLLFALGMGLQRAMRFVMGGNRSWVWSWQVAQLIIMALLWSYIGLLGFPVAATRAALMGSALLCARMSGLTIPQGYVLCLAAGLMLAYDPSSLYDLSFQFSFLAYWQLLWALRYFPPRSVKKGNGLVVTLHQWSTPMARFIALNVWLTAWILLGLSPIAVHTFGQLSLLAFVGNLLITPFLGLIILPLGVVGFFISTFHLILAGAGTVGGSAVETFCFMLLDQALNGWIALVLWIERLGEQGILALDLAWSRQAWFAYYVTLFGVMAMIQRTMTQIALLKRQRQ